MDIVSNRKGNPSVIKRLVQGRALFPMAVLALYGVIAIFMPEKALHSLKNGTHMLLDMIFPLFFIFLLMVVINIFLMPSGVSKYLGKGAGIKAWLLSAAAGIISSGPIYAWYPLLKDLREKGATNSLIAVFLYNRSVKPFLLPIMMAYFGWIYVVMLTIMTVITSFGIGGLMNALLGKAIAPSCSNQS